MCVIFSRTRGRRSRTCWTVAEMRGWRRWMGCSTSWAETTALQILIRLSITTRRRTLGSPFPPPWKSPGGTWTIYFSTWAKNAPVVNRFGRKIFHFKPECSATREWPLSIVQNVSTQWQRSIPTCMTLKQTPTELMTDRKHSTVTFDCIPLLSHWNHLFRLCRHILLVFPTYFYCLDDISTSKIWIGYTVLIRWVIAGCWLYFHLWVKIW